MDPIIKRPKVAYEGKHLEKAIINLGEPLILILRVTKAFTKLTSFDKNLIQV